MPDFSKRLEKADKYLQKGRQADALDEYLNEATERIIREEVYGDSTEAPERTG